MGCRVCTVVQERVKKIFVYVCMYVGMHVCMYTCVFMCVYVCMYVCVNDRSLSTKMEISAFFVQLK